jgi:hypothetical protein
MARARIKIDLQEVEDLAAMGMTQGQIADCLGISTSTLDRRKQDNGDFEAALKRGKARGIRAAVERLHGFMEGNRGLGATIFYLKAQAGWSDDSRDEIARLKMEFQQEIEAIRDRAKEEAERELLANAQRLANLKADKRALGTVVQVLNHCRDFMSADQYADFIKTVALDERID